MNQNALTTIYILRHAQSQNNANFDAGIHSTQDTPLGSDLTELGLQQSQEIADKLKDLHFDVIFSSELTRAKRTAEIIAAERNLAVQTKETLKERARGNLGGKTEAEIRQTVSYVFGDPHKLTHQEWLKFKLFDDMESAEETINRFITALREIAVAYPGKNVLAVSHGNIMRAFLVHLGFGTHRELSHGAISNTGYIKVETDGVDFFLKETYNINKRTINNEE